jgi:uncharacterized membrane protein YheB (UPF0754 family)
VHHKKWALAAVSTNLSRINNMTRHPLLTLSSATNLLALGVCLAGRLVPAPWGEWLWTAGIFALSGSVTNWLAIYMLFERVPGLYGSGVIPARFEEFKRAIKTMLMEQFFHSAIVERFLLDSLLTQDAMGGRIDALKQRIDLDKIYEGLVAAILESSFGGMIRMMGGPSALEPLKEPIQRKLSAILDDTVQDLKASSSADNTGKALSARITISIEHIIDQRLMELTPQMVKKIIQDMIRQHLGWLVVWGGVFGALMGVAAAVIKAVSGG